jgi:DNA-directed RNA polymerase
VAADPGLLWRRDIDEKGKPQAKEPFQFVAACLEYIAADTHGSEYVSRLPVWLDATSNGLQHLAIMRRDTKLAAMVNLKVTEHDLGIQDVYDIVAKHARQTLYADDDPSSRIWAQRNDLRDLLKQPIMTLPYGLIPILTLNNPRSPNRGARWT